ncbi:MAG: G8 domain-containing protein [Pseudomonadota bacterium]
MKTLRFQRNTLSVLILSTFGLHQAPLAAETAAPEVSPAIRSMVNTRLSREEIRNFETFLAALEASMAKARAEGRDADEEDVPDDEDLDDEDLEEEDPEDEDLEDEETEDEETEDGDLEDEDDDVEPDDEDSEDDAEDGDSDEEDGPDEGDDDRDDEEADDEDDTGDSDGDDSGGDDSDGDDSDGDDSDGDDSDGDDSDGDDSDGDDSDGDGSDGDDSDGDGSDGDGDGDGDGSQLVDREPTAPTNLAECTFVANNMMELVALEHVTHTAVASGNWSSPATWANNTVPTDGARVHIPPQTTVTLDGQASARLETVRVDGTLAFANTVNTRLLVDTLVSTMMGQLHVGTASAPIQDTVTAEVVFVDDGAVNAACDTTQVGRGALLMGRTEMHGAAKTHRAVLAAPAARGAQTIELNAMPSGWAVGDQIVITGTVVGDPRSDEVRTVSSINGRIIGFDQPLALDHAAPSAGLNVYVANTTRNIEFRSENPSLHHRAHMMLMHTLDVSIENARFTDMGRTDKTHELDDIRFEFSEDAVGNNSGAPVVFTTSRGNSYNVRGRYPIHFHRGGVDPSSTPALVRGSVVFNSPGWGFVMHSAHVNFVDNVSYDVQGTGFYTEAGDEIGSMQGNIAIRSVNDAFQFDSVGGAIDPDLGHDNQEFGNDGDGYWLSGHGVSMINNVSAGSTAHGIIYWADGLVEADLANPGRRTVKVAHVENGNLIPNREEIPTWWAPVAEISGNEAYGSSIGFRVRYTHSQSYMGEGGSAFHAPPPQAYIDTLNPTISGLTVWGNRDGVLLNYTARMSLKDSRIVGIGAPFYLDPGTANSGVGLDLGTEITNGFGHIDSVTIEGFEMGFVAPRNDQWLMENLTLRNVRDMLISEPVQGPRTITMNNVTFGDLSGTAVAGRESERRNIELSPVLEVDFQPYYFVLPDHLVLDGRGIYFPQQAASYVPLPELLAPGDEPGSEQVPQRFVGQTNQQLLTQYGLAFGGAILPADAQTDARVTGGFVGSAPAAATTLPPLRDTTNGGANPEPAEGNPWPEITGNYLNIKPGQTLTLMRTNLNATDTDSAPSELRYSVSQVRGGYFAHRDNPTTAIAGFTQAEVDGGVIRFVHGGGSVVPSYAVTLTDGTTQSPVSTVRATLIP